MITNTSGTMHIKPAFCFRSDDRGDALGLDNNKAERYDNARKIDTARIVCE
jgi:hypothetical protein